MLTSSPAMAAQEIRSGGRRPANSVIETRALDTVLDSLEESKAEKVVTIEISAKTTIADNMVIASGRSQRHVSAIAERLIEDLKNAGHGRVRAEGMPACDWVLLDANDVIIHIFRPEVRDFYNLEKMWASEPPTPTVSA